MKRVAAYCRVSTDKDDQINSLENQKKYFNEYIDRNPMWELTRIYADEGITGTSTKKRHAFNQMIEDAHNHVFDLLLTKEISRFARNTLDSIYFTRKLKDLGVGVVFLNDNINTLDADAELRLTIMSSIAQEESRKTSDRVKWGQKRRMEQGVVFGRDMLGYDVRNGKLIINEEGAKVVRQIFHKFVNEDKGTHVIARELREAGIATATHMKKWSNTMILRVLRNEKYCGDLVQKKTYTPDYLNHDKKYNHGEEEYVEIKDHHEPIISHELFEKAQRELARRSLTDEQKAKHSNRYCFSGKIKCGICGCSYVSRTKKRKDGSVYKAWRCHEAARHGSRHIDKAGNEIGCSNRSLNNEDLKNVMQHVIRNLAIDKETVIDDLNQTIKSVLETENTTDRSLRLNEELEDLKKKRQGLIELYLNREISKDDFRQLTEKYETEINAVETEIKTAEEVKTTYQQKAQLPQEIANTIRALASGDKWDDTYYRNLLNKIVVYENNVLDIYLRLLPGKISYLVYDTHYTQENNAIRRRHFDTPAGTEELAHLEMVGSMVKQLTENASIEEIKKAGLDAYYSDHDKAVYPVSAAGVPFTAAYIQSKGDPMTDLYEDMAAEQKARSTYEYLINLADDPDVIEPLKFLREREIVHFQRFGESLRLVQDYLENRKRFSIPKTFGTKSVNEMNMKAMPEPYAGDFPGRRIGDIRIRNTDSIPTMQMMRDVPFNESRNVPGMAAEQRLPVNPQANTMPGGMNMPGTANIRGTMPNQTTMPGNMNMPGTNPSVRNMPGSANIRGTMPNQTTMPGNMNMPGANPSGMNMPGTANMRGNMPNQTTMPGNMNMPNMRDMQNVPKTQKMPETRRVQMPREANVKKK